jgi:hypothetical protein
LPSLAPLSTLLGTEPVITGRSLATGVIMAEEDEVEEERQLELVLL